MLSAPGHSAHIVEFIIDGRSLIGYKKRLANVSSYFHRLFFGGFKESSMTQIVVSDVDYESFENLLSFIDGGDYTADPALLSLIRKYDVRIMDEHSLHKLIDITPDLFQQYAEVILQEYPELPQKVIDIIASKVPKDTDLSWMNPAVRERIIWSKNCLYFNKNNHYVEEILLTPKTAKKSVYQYRMDDCDSVRVKACSAGYALLKIRGHVRERIYRDYVKARTVYESRVTHPDEWISFRKNILYDIHDVNISFDYNKLYNDSNNDFIDQIIGRIEECANYWVNTRENAILSDLLPFIDEVDPYEYFGTLRKYFICKMLVPSVPVYTNIVTAPPQPQPRLNIIPRMAPMFPPQAEESDDEGSSDETNSDED